MCSGITDLHTVTKHTTWNLSTSWEMKHEPLHFWKAMPSKGSLPSTGGATWGPYWAMAPLASVTLLLDSSPVSAPARLPFTDLGLV